MKAEIRQIVGKTISGVIIGENPERSPRVQLFLIFNDGTYFEIYGGHFTCAGGIDKGDAEKAASYAKHCGAKIIATYP